MSHTLYYISPYLPPEGHAMPAAPSDPLPEKPEERKKIIAIGRKAMESFGVEDLTDHEIETILRKSWLEWEPKIMHVLAKTGQLEF